jgi:hypothetical protein
MESTDGWKWQERCRCLLGLGRHWTWMAVDGAGHGTKADKLAVVACSPLLQGAHAGARHTVSISRALSLAPPAPALLAQHGTACVRAEKTSLTGRRSGECMQRT